MKIFMPATPPIDTVTPNTIAFLRDAMIAPTGFREYDARWKYPDEINLPGIQALGLGLGTQMHEAGVRPDIVVANDYRDYSLAVKQALMIGLMQAGIRVHDIGPALSPTAYFARKALDIPAVAMVTASHNPNGWTGVKMGFAHPLTHGQVEMARLKEIVLGGQGVARPGGSIGTADGIGTAYIADLVGTTPLKRRLKVVCACGNGTAGAFAPEVLRRLGAEVVELHCTPDYTFPHYNPNPEAMEMLHDMADAVRAHGADLAVGFDGDGDRCGFVDERGHEIFADRMGLILARDWVRAHPGARFVVDVKSTGLFASDPVLHAAGAVTEYWKTGHSYMKSRVAETGALAGFEKSGHFFIAAPLGHGYDCGLRVAVEVLRMLDAHPGQSLGDIDAGVPRAYTTPTMSPFCADTQKYDVLSRIIADLAALRDAGGTLGGQTIADILTVNGARVQLADGGFGLVRASSNTPNLVVVCESPESEASMRAIFADLDKIIRRQPQVGAYDQSI
jgi:phosphomannomutase/phosphoglucomutase